MALQIALRIAGTKQRKAGFAPLVTVGILAGKEGDNMDRSPIVAEKPAYVVKHTADYILYQLIDRRVKSFDADAPGVLSIALTLSKDVQMAEGRSPYSLLQEVYDRFLTTYMTHLSDGRDSFLNIDADSDIFRQIVEQYPLEKRNTPYIPMNPQGITGIVCVPQDKLEDFFRDTQYQEFAQFKDIEVGVACQAQTSIGLEELVIPRPVNYDIWVNGIATSYSISNPSDVYTARQQPSRNYEYDTVSFTLGELLSAEDNKLRKGDSTVVLDTANNRISCTLGKREIEYRLEFGWNGGTDEEKWVISAWIAEEKLKLKLGDLKINEYFNAGKFLSVQAGKTKEKVEVTPQRINNIALSVSSHRDDTNRILNITISIVKKEGQQKKVPQTSGRFQGSPYMNSSNSPMQKLDTGVQTMKPECTVSKSFSQVSFLLIGLLIGLVLGIAGTLYWVQGGEEPKPKPEGLSEEFNIADSVETTPNVAFAADEPVADEPVAGEPVAGEPVAGEPVADEPATESPEDQNRAKEEILQLVNGKDIRGCRNHKGWQKCLTQEERLAIEAVLNLEQYRARLVKNKVKELVQGKTFTWKSLEETRQKIIGIVSGYEEQKEQKKNQKTP